MDLVVDANILFSAMIRQLDTYRLFFRNDLHLFTPSFIFSELRKHKQIILVKSGKSNHDFERFLRILGRRMIIVPIEDLATYLYKAEKVSPDPGDVAYVALALKLRCAIWSHDAALKKRLHGIRVYTTEELL